MNNEKLIESTKDLLAKADVDQLLYLLNNYDTENKRKFNSLTSSSKIFVGLINEELSNRASKDTLFNEDNENNEKHT